MLTHSISYAGALTCAHFDHVKSNLVRQSSFNYYAYKYIMYTFIMSMYSVHNKMHIINNIIIVFCCKQLSILSLN